MGTLRGVECVTGEYVGDGQGEADKTESAIDASTNVLDSELQYIADDAAEQDDEDESSGDVSESRPLLILYNCETTGLSIYSDHTNLGAKVIQPPVSVPNATCSSLVQTSRTFLLLVFYKYIINN